jgi:nitric-oxide synthase
MTLTQLIRSRRRARGLAAALPPADAGEACEFLAAFYAEHPALGSPASRIAQVRREISLTGMYSHTGAELSWAARVAWRHAARCSGRVNWRTLRVRDRRHLSESGPVAAEVIEHLRQATNGGRVRSFITIFAPDTPARPGPRILNCQAVRYAGYPRPSGGFLGDPGNAELTELAASLGWRGAGTAFDILPLIIRDPAGHVRMYDIPPGAVLEVPITHPEFEWFAALDLRWYAVPLIADMYLDAGGIRYPCAPFNGWYQAGTEVGVRDLGDTGRYDMLPVVAAGMGLDISSTSTFWPDRAAVELAVAVQHSYRAAGVMATDHHAEARRFMRFAADEQEAGRLWCADWSWVNPPISASTTPTFHQAYPNPVLKPGFFRHEGLLPSR